MMSPTIITSNFCVSGKSSSRSTLPGIMFKQAYSLIFVDYLDAVINADNICNLAELPVQRIICKSDALRRRKIR